MMVRRCGKHVATQARGNHVSSFYSEAHLGRRNACWDGCGNASVECGWQFRRCLEHQLHYEVRAVSGVLCRHGSDR